MPDFVAEVVAEPGAISALTERVSGHLADLGVDARTTHHVALVLDELLMNIASHGGGGQTQAVVRLTVTPDRVDGQVLDGGAQFDPSRPRNIDVSAKLE